MKKSLSFLQFSGFVFTGILGTLLHFIFELTNESFLAGLFSAVNESIWEHMKLLYFPMLIYAMVECYFLKEKYPNFWCAKAVGFLVGLTTIPVLYYTYTGILGVNVDWFNILIFFIAAAISFYIETKIMNDSKRCFTTPTISKLIILIIGILFLIFTFSPPKIPLFRDPLSSTFGFFNTI